MISVTYIRTKGRSNSFSTHWPVLLICFNISIWHFAHTRFIYIYIYTYMIGLYIYILHVSDFSNLYTQPTLFHKSYHMCNIHIICTMIVRDSLKSVISPTFVCITLFPCALRYPPQTRYNQLQGDVTETVCVHSLATGYWQGIDSPWQRDILIKQSLTGLVRWRWLDATYFIQYVPYNLYDSSLYLLEDLVYLGLAFLKLDEPNPWNKDHVNLTPLPWIMSL